MKIKLAVPLFCLAFLFCCRADHNSNQVNHYKTETKRLQTIEVVLRIRRCHIRVARLECQCFTEDWVELGLYLLWFPYNQEYGPFTFEIEAVVMPGLV